MASYLKKATLWCSLLAAIGIPLFSLEVQDWVTGNFEARPFHRRVVTSPLDGFLSSVYVDEGDRVQSGSLVARLEIPEMESRIAQGRARVKQARAQLSLVCLDRCHSMTNAGFSSVWQSTQDSS